MNYKIGMIIRFKYSFNNKYKYCRITEINTGSIKQLWGHWTHSLDKIDNKHSSNWGYLELTCPV